MVKRRIWFKMIDSVGTFPDGRIKMDIRFRDDGGNEYVWTPKWSDVMNIYAAGERVEELNVEKGEWLDNLKKEKQFSDEVLTVIASIIGDTHTGGEITEFFSAAGFPEVKHDGSTKWRFVREELRRLNKKGYQNIVQVIRKLVDPKKYINREEQRDEIIKSLNGALQYEGLTVTKRGEVQPLKFEE